MFGLQGFVSYLFKKLKYLYKQFVTSLKYRCDTVEASIKDQLRVG